MFHYFRPRKKKHKSRLNQAQSSSEHPLDPKTQFGVLYQRYYTRVFKFVRKSITRQDLAEELTQEIFLKLYQHKDSYSHQFDIAAWIWSISRNALYDYLRQIRSSLSKLSSLDDLFLTQNYEPSSLITAESLLIEQHHSSLIPKLLAQLPKRQREILTLRLIDEFSYEEISQRMKLSVSAVKSLLHRTKQNLIKLSHQYSLAA